MSGLGRQGSSVLCAAVVAGLAAAASRPPTTAGTPLPGDLILVQIPVTAAPRAPTDAGGFTPLDRYVDGARIVRLDPATGQVMVLTPGFAAAADPDVSPDGQYIVFAGRREPGASWQIWTMKADGSSQTPITRGPGRHVGPVFAGARFYLDDARPTPQIVFAATATDTGPLSLYATDLDGDTLHRLTFNLQGDFSPAVLPTGQIVFSSWQRYGDQFEPDSALALLAVNIDGTDLMPFYGSHEPPRYKDMPAATVAGGRVYFVESDHPSWLGGGNLAYVAWRRPFRSHATLNGEADGTGLFHSPTPLPDGGLLASYRHSAADSVFGIYRVDPATGRRLERVFAQDGWHSIDPQVLVPRPPLKGRANWLKPGATTGVFYCLNAYHTAPGAGGDRTVLPPGTIRHVRVIEGQPRRILGVAPVEPDGSFHVRVPAETPLTFQLLDADYVALRTQRAWTWVMGNENRGCVGCHEDPELSPPNRLVTAIAKPAVDLVLPPARRRTVDFRHQIAPILAARCATADCHATGRVEPALGAPGGAPPEAAARTVYGFLVPAARADGRYVVPGQAGASPLIRRLLGRGTGASAAGGARHGGLDRRELILLIEWVDLGAAWDALAGGDGRAP